MHQLRTRSYKRLFLVSAFCAMALLFLQACPDSNNAFRSCVYTLSNPEPPAGPNPAPNNEVIVFQRSTNDGRLSFVGRFLTGGFGSSFTGGTNQHSIVYRERDTERDLYVVNPGAQPAFAGTVNEGQGSITAFTIQDDCTLERNGPVVPSGGTLPGSLAINAGSNLLYVANEGNIPGDVPPNLAPGSVSGFRINTDGTLQPIAGSTFVFELDAFPGGNPEGELGNTPVDIAINPEGTRLIVTRLTGNGIDSFAIDADGRLSDRQSIPAGGGPFGFSFHPTRSLILVTLAEALFNDPTVPELNRAPGLASYRVRTNGVLSFIDAYTDANDPNLIDPCWTVFTRSADRIWTSSFIPRSINLFELADDGSVDLLSAFNSQDTDPDTGKVIGGLDIDRSPDGDFVYQLRAFDVDFLLDPNNAEFLVPRIDVFRTTGDRTANAGLERVQSIRLPDDQADAGSMGLLVVDLERQGLFN